MICQSVNQWVLDFIYEYCREIQCLKWKKGDGGSGGGGGRGRRPSRGGFGHAKLVGGFPSYIVNYTHWSFVISYLKLETCVYSSIQF